MVSPRFYWESLVGGTGFETVTFQSGRGFQRRVDDNWTTSSFSTNFQKQPPCVFVFRKPVGVVSGINRKSAAPAQCLDGDYVPHIFAVNVGGQNINMVGSNRNLPACYHGIKFVLNPGFGNVVRGGLDLDAGYYITRVHQKIVGGVVSEWFRNNKPRLVGS